MNMLCRMVRQDLPSDAPVVVAGDFNDWRRSAHDLLEKGEGVHEVFVKAHGRPARTFPARMPMVQLDRIYARGLRPLSSHTPHGAIWARMSDHLPLTAEFAF
jgi:endonuclease/exonuclease/phosphatase family metal-dependent hydrolase